MAPDGTRYREVGAAGDVARRGAALGPGVWRFLADRGATDRDHPVLAGLPEVFGPAGDATGPVGEFEALAAADERSVDPGLRRRRGFVATPPEVVGRLVDWCLELERPWPRFLEPGCGHGPFLEHAFRRLIARPGADPARVLASLFGIDLDPVAVALARVRLLAAALEVAGPGILDALGTVSIGVVAGDWLLEPGEPGGPPAAWAGLAFDAIAGNPPYVRIEAYDGPAATLRARYRSARGKFDLSAPFLERAAGALAPGGRLAVVTTGKVATQNYGAAIRRILAEEASIEFALDLSGSDLFGGVAANPMLLGAVATAPSPGHEVRIGRLDRLPDRGLEGGVRVAATSLASEAWRFGVAPPAAREADATIGDVARRIGYDYISGCQEAFAAGLTRSTARRFGIEPDRLVPNVRPGSIHGLGIAWTGRRPRRDTWLLFTHDDEGRPLAELPPGTRAYLERFRERLEARRDWDRIPYRESGRRWSELHQLAWRPGTPRLLLLRNARVATCLADPGGRYIACDRFHAYAFEGGWTDQARLLLVYLDSARFDADLKARATRIHGDAAGLYEYEKKFVAPLGVRWPRGELRARWLAAADRIVALTPRLAAADPYELPWDRPPDAREAVAAWREAWGAIDAEVAAIQREIDRVVPAAWGLPPDEPLARVPSRSIDRVLADGLADRLADHAEAVLASTGRPRRVETIPLPEAARTALAALGERPIPFLTRRLLEEAAPAGSPDPATRFRVQGRGRDRSFALASTPGPGAEWGR